MTDTEPTKRPDADADDPRAEDDAVRPQREHLGDVTDLWATVKPPRRDDDRIVLMGQKGDKWRPATRDEIMAMLQEHAAEK